MARPKEKLLTADDLLRLESEGIRGELIRGGALRDGANSSKTRPHCGESDNSSGWLHQAPAVWVDLGFRSGVSCSNATLIL